MSMSLLIDVIVVAGFGMLLFLLHRVRRNLLQHPSGWFLPLFGVLYLVLGVIHLLRQGGAIEQLGQYDYLLEVFFPPLFVLFILPIFALYVFSIFMRHDLQLRLDAEDEIRASEARYRHLFQYSLEGRCLMNDGHVTAVNQSMLSMLGVGSEAEVVGHSLDEWVVPEQRGEFASLFQGQGEEPVVREFAIAGGDGGRRHLEVMLKRSVVGKEPCIQCACRDVTARWLAEKKVREAGMFLQHVLDGVGDCVMVIDRQYRVLMMNAAARRLHSLPEVLPQPLYCYAVSHHRQEPCSGADHPCPLRDLFAGGKPKRVVHRHFRHDGSDCHLEIAASPITDDQGNVVGIVEAGRDVSEKVRIASERRRLEARIRRQHKDRSVATLARGMAHDFNNLLATVQGNVEILEMDRDERQRPFLEKIGKAAARMTDLTSQLMAYAREGRYQEKEVRPDELMAEALALCGLESNEAIVVRTAVADDLWPVKGDPSQLVQMLANLITNACEAMAGGGELTLQMENSPDKQEWECSRRQQHPAGDYVHLAIRDTGGGVKPGLHHTLFDPFVSSKEFGRGLGLAAVAGIAHSHGGCVTMQSIAGRGATFHVYLPVVPPRPEEAGQTIPAAPVA
ncbi:MAG: PAS domain S-box protein [Thermodesulfobacteriota bacterium]